MAKNKGIIKVQGKLDGLVFYRRNGVEVVQRAGGFDGVRIKTEGRYEKTRQLAGEFGQCASLASVFKRELAPFLATIPDPYVYNWIQKRLVMVKDCDAVSPKGAKTVSQGLQTVEGKKRFEGFSFNRNKGLRGVLFAPYRVDLTQGSLTLPAFCPLRDFNFAKGGTVGGMQLVLLRLDLADNSCVMTSSDLYVFEKGDAQKQVVLNAEVPTGYGILTALLFVGNCDLVSNDIEWYKNEGNVIEIVKCLL